MSKGIIQIFYVELLTVLTSVIEFCDENVYAQLENKNSIHQIITKHTSC